MVYLGDEWESLKQLFSTPFFFFFSSGGVMIVFFKLAFVLSMLNSLSFCLSDFFSILMTS